MDKEIIKLKRHTYYQKNKEIIKLKRHIYYQTNKQLILEQHKKYYQEHVLGDTLGTSIYTTL